MTSRTLSDEQIKALDFQTDQLYASLRRAVETQSHQDAVWSRGLFDTFERSLSETTHNCRLTSWEGDISRAPPLNKYLLHYALGGNSSLILEEQTRFRDNTGCKPEAMTTETTVDTLKQAIDDNKVPYKIIQSMAMSLAKAQDFAGIVEAMGYVREKYLKSSYILKRDATATESKRPSPEQAKRLMREKRIDELNRTLVQLINDEQIMGLTRRDDPQKIAFAQQGRLPKEVRLLHAKFGDDYPYYHHLTLYHGELYVVMGGISEAGEDKKLASQPPRTKYKGFVCYLIDGVVKFSQKVREENQAELIHTNLAELMSGYNFQHPLEEEIKQLKQRANPPSP